MPTSGKRDNSYWADRLQRDGHHELLARVEADEISMYRATLKVGYRSKQPKSPAGKLSYHWKRANHDERKQFVLAHAREINRVLKEVAQEAAAKKNSR